MFELKVFQTNSAKLMADRYAFFAGHSDRPRKGNRPRPFFQALAALTGAGKTPILAEAVSLLRGHLTTEPIILWMSRGKSVVAQTYANFSGGKYTEIVDGFRVINIQNITPGLIADGTTPLIVMTTTGLFNNRDQSAGSLKVYKRENDLFGDKSPWERLIERAHGGIRRPLVIVYDEGHNLSPQQTDLLGELEPDAYLLASATHRLPPNFVTSVVQPINLWVEEATADTTRFAELRAVDDSGKRDADRFVTTTVKSDDVVKAQLVKKAIQFDGTTAAMESCLDELSQRLDLLNTEIEARGLNFRPKAIYVCKTNVTDEGENDDHTLPFMQRKAPPIRIWRYLVESKGVDPSRIAIYANLKFVEGNKPDEVNLFSKDETDFDEFTAGDFQHIIFNLSLQEGWDDPACYLAYIDKSMGSAIQVEQIIGRVLRQYGAKHYDNGLLNSAHFFLRVDKRSVFTESIERVQTKLQAEGTPIEITANFGGGGGGAEDLSPKDGITVELHHIFVDSGAARQRIGEIVDEFPTFTEGDANTIGEAQAATATVNLEALNSGAATPEWKPSGNTNAMRLRWLVNTAIKSRSSHALAVVDLKDAKFDVRVQMQSKADKLADKLAREIVEAYYQRSDLVYESNDPFRFGTIRVPQSASSFANGLYAKYGGLNKLELPFANAIDRAGYVWHRNPSSGGFFIPLLSEGDTASFYPDFIVWRDGKLFCLDTKASHLLTDAVARKLFDIKEDGVTRLQVRFITEGKQTELRGKVIKGGFTVWKMKSGTPTAIHHQDIDAAVQDCLV